MPYFTASSTSVLIPYESYCVLENRDKGLRGCKNTSTIEYCEIVSRDHVSLLIQRSVAFFVFKPPTAGGSV